MSDIGHCALTLIKIDPPSAQKADPPHHGSLNPKMKISETEKE
jgi:hypothetical protein